MSRRATLIAAAFAVALSAGAASALPLVPQPGPAPEAAPPAEAVHYRKVRRSYSYYPYVYHRRHSRPSFSFSLNFGSPVVRHYPRYYYPYQAYQPYYVAPYHYRRSYVPYYEYRW